jgi:tricorn protease
MYRTSLLLTVILLAMHCSSFAEEARLLRFPDVHTDRVAFVYAGDIYVAPRAGGEAARLTSHIGLELFPKFSPDGSMIAFTGQYDGDMSVYTIPVDGGDPTRLTYHPGIQKTSERFGPENLVLGWHPDGEHVLFRSRKEPADWWDGRAYLVSLNGGLPEPLPMNAAGFTSFSPDAKMVAYSPIFRDFRTWKRYKGGMAQDVWTFDLENMTAKKITNWVGSDNMPMWYDNKIYFNSDRTGTLNLFCYDLGNGETRQVTEFTDFDVRWPSLGPDGIAFENAGYIYVLDLPSEKLNKIVISLRTDRHAMRPEYVNVSGKVRDFHLSPDGNRAVFSARGEIFTVPKKDGNTRNLTNSSDANDRLPKWSPNGKWICYISDTTGEEELYLVSHDDKERIRLTTDGHCRRYETRWSPDSKKIAFSDKNLALYVVNVDEKKTYQIDKADRNEIRRYSWSPDSRFLAYTKRDKARISSIFVYSFDDSKVHRVTEGFTNDFNPIFDPDGEYLYFLSERNFNPILGSYEFEFVNEAITNLFLILLRSDQESPFGPKSDEVDTTQIVGKKKSDEDGKDKKESVNVVIDFDGIFDRQVAFDLRPGNYGGLNAVSGAVYYFSRPIYGLRGKILDDKNVLHKYDMEKKKDYEFAEGISGYRFASNGEKIILRKGPDFFITGTEGDKVDLKDKKLDLSHMEMYLDRSAEYEQMFDEVWRIERDFFYDAEMHGVDWVATGEKYRKLLPYATHRFDLTYLLGEMIGELSCSHTYIGGGDAPKVSGSKIGLLGANFKIDKENNRIRIARILRGENWDDYVRSPLLDPGVDIDEGDYLLAIDGKEITADVNPYSLTLNTVGKTVVLTVNDQPSFEGAREVTIKPIAAEEPIRYFDAVERNREYVDSVSSGSIGYIHIPDMDSYGLFRFAKMFYHQIRKPGLIIDVRYNGGGFVSGLILERLRRVVMAMGMGRNTAPGPMPGSGLNAHMITLLNEFSCSDGDYFPYFFREYGLGPLMGKRSWGGVIGIRGYTPLIDGGYFTIPEWGIYGLDGEWIMENVGVVPDIEIDNTPDRLARGYDDQLDAAIEYIMKKIDADPKTLPPLPPPPKTR